MSWLFLLRIPFLWFVLGSGFLFACLCFLCFASHLVVCDQFRVVFVCVLCSLGFELGLRGLRVYGLGNLDHMQEPSLEYCMEKGGLGVLLEFSLSFFGRRVGEWGGES